MKKILITGTSKGLGNFLANHFLKNGDYVIGLSRTPSEISHPCYEEYTIDISDNAQVIKTIHCLNEIDVLINNAAISMMNSFFTSPIEMLDQIYKLNVRAPYFLTQEISKKNVVSWQGYRNQYFHNRTWFKDRGGITIFNIQSGP
jgi:3-oxoacyl-[acyl-carrier protein] reductase